MWPKDLTGLSGNKSSLGMASEMNLLEGPHLTEKSRVKVKKLVDP